MNGIVNYIKIPLEAVESGFYVVLNALSSIYIFNVSLMYYIILFIFLAELANFLLYCVSGGDSE